VVQPGTIDSKWISAPGRDSGSDELVAFVLTGGASHAAVQVGMLDALLQAGIRPDLLVGTSAGAVNAVAYAADPTEAGISRMIEGWRRMKRSQIFPLKSSGLVLGAIGRRDHLLSNRGLAMAIEQFVGIQRLEASSIPVHVVATDLLTGDPLVLSDGPVLAALLASTAIPGVFPPVDIAGRLLVDGAVASNTPIMQAETLGASTIYVLPTSGVGAEAGRGSSPIRLGLYAIGRRLGWSTEPSIVTTRRSVVRVVPAPPTSAISPYDFSRSARLIHQAAAITRAWLATDDARTASQPSRAF
jgi:NTE family protein